MNPPPNLNRRPWRRNLQPRNCSSPPATEHRHLHYGTPAAPARNPLTAGIPDNAGRIVVIDASEKGIAAVTAHIEELAARTSHAPGSITEVSGLNGIMVIPTGRGRLPRSVRLRLKILSGAHPVLMCPWVPALAGRLCDDAALEQIAASKLVASAVKKLNAQMEALTANIT